MSASPAYVLVLPGNGSVTNGTDVWTITSGQLAQANGSNMSGGGGTSALYWDGSNLFGQDAGGTGWYKWSGSGTSGSWSSVTSPLPH